MKKKIKTQINNLWQIEWDNNGGHLKSYKPKVEKWTYPHNLSRKEQVVLCRLRLGHTHITHSYLLIGGSRPRCQSCHDRLTIQHLFTCNAYANSRHRFQLDNVNPLQNNLNHIHSILAFIKEINFFGKI